MMIFQYANLMLFLWLCLTAMILTLTLIANILIVPFRRSFALAAAIIAIAFAFQSGKSSGSLSANREHTEFVKHLFLVLSERTSTDKTRHVTSLIDTFRLPFYEDANTRKSLIMTFSGGGYDLEIEKLVQSSNFSKKGFEVMFIQNLLGAALTFFFVTGLLVWLVVDDGQSTANKTLIVSSLLTLLTIAFVSGRVAGVISSTGENTRFVRDVFYVLSDLPQDRCEKTLLKLKDSFRLPTSVGPFRESEEFLLGELIHGEIGLSEKALGSAGNGSAPPHSRSDKTEK